MKGNFKNIIYKGLWLLIGVGTIVLFIAALQSRKNENCSNYRIKIKNDQQGSFITQFEIDDLINTDGNVKAKKN